MKHIQKHKFVHRFPAIAFLVISSIKLQGVWKIMKKVVFHSMIFLHS